MSLLLNEIELPLRIKTTKVMSDAEFARFCAANEPNRFERDTNGEIIVMSPCFSDGGSVELDIAAELRAWALVDGRGKAFGPNAGFTLPDGSVRAADASWILLERWNRYSEQERKRSFTAICPEFVVEVRSESDRLADAQEKMSVWIRNGAELAWLIDPQRKVVEIYRPAQELEVHENPSSVQGTGCVAGFELVMARDGVEPRGVHFRYESSLA